MTLNFRKAPRLRALIVRGTKRGRLYALETDICTQPDIRDRTREGWQFIAWDPADEAAVIQWIEEQHGQDVPMVPKKQGRPKSKGDE